MTTKQKLAIELAMQKIKEAEHKIAEAEKILIQVRNESEVKL